MLSPCCGWPLACATPSKHGDAKRKNRTASAIKLPPPHPTPPPLDLSVGEMTPEPVKTQFGYHLILCEGRKA
jgi:hypothetical protein